MARFIHGDRIGKKAKLRPSVIALIFNRNKEAVLLTRRTDNGLWCLPGGAMDPGESVDEACVREVLEETGLAVRITRLVGVYSTPHRIIEYADGNQYQALNMAFEVEVLGGSLQLNEEVSEFGYFPVDRLDTLDLMCGTKDRINDAVVGCGSTFIR